MTDTGLENLCDRRVRQDQKGGPQLETRNVSPYSPTQVL